MTEDVGPDQVLTPLSAEEAMVAFGTEREEQLSNITGHLDLSIAQALTWVGNNAPLTDVEQQMIDHHIRDMRKVLEALALLAGESTTNAKIKALERAL